MSLSYIEDTSRTPACAQYDVFALDTAGASGTSLISVAKFSS